MIDREFFKLRTPHFLLEGRSRAGHETAFRIREADVAFDIGRCPDFIVPMNHVFITHMHLDHAAGIPFYAGQRRLQKLGPGNVYVPSEAADDVRQLMDVQAKLTGSDIVSLANIVGVSAGEELRISRNHLVRAYAATHRVAARAWELVEVRHHLRGELAGRDGAEIARLRREGVQVDEQYQRSIVFYTGDTDRGLLESCEALYRAEVLIIECSFVGEDDLHRAAQYRHIHIDDIAAFADRFANEMIVLTHFSRRYANDEMRKVIRRRLPASLHERIRLGLPEPWQLL